MTFPSLQTERYVGPPFSRQEAWLHIATMLGHRKLRGEVLHKEPVISLIRRENLASIRIAENLGERVEGHTGVLGGEALIYGIRRD